MLTLDQLCAEMERSGHHLTPRAARDWWTKGLLPRPQRRGLGRGKGTLTFWTSPRILQQAQAVDELFARHCRTYTAIIGLWLRGFSVDPKLVREAYFKLIDRHAGWVWGQSDFNEAGDFLGELAEKIARRMTKSGKFASATNEISDLCEGVLSIFYGLDGDLPEGGLKALLGAAPPQAEQETFATGYNLAVLARYLRRRLWGWASLPRRRKALLSATDNELARARRVIHLAFGCLARLTPPGQEEAFEEIGNAVLIAFGRPMLPILVSALREPLGRETVHFLLQFALLIKREGSQYLLRFEAGPSLLAPQGEEDYPYGSAPGPS